MLQLRPSMTLTIHQRYVTAFDISPVDEHLLSGDIDGNLYLIHFGSSTILHHHELQSEARMRHVSSIAYRPDGIVAAVAIGGGYSGGEVGQSWEHIRRERIELWDTRTWNKVGEIFAYPTGAITWSPDGRYLAFPSGSGIRIYDGANYSHIVSVSGWVDNVSHIAFSPSGKH